MTDPTTPRLTIPAELLSDPFAQSRRIGAFAAKLHADAGTAGQPGEQTIRFEVEYPSDGVHGSRVDVLDALENGDLVAVEFGQPSHG